MSKPIEAILPLTSMQQGMLFHSLREPGAGTYLEHLSGELPERFDAAAFRQAWELVVRRHDPLRAFFVWGEGKQPLQLIRAQVELPWREFDWRDRDAAAQELALKDLAHAERTEGFALDRAPLMRVTLVRLGEDRWRFLWTLHHALLDGWSLPIVLGEVGRAYQALCEGKTPVLPPARPFREYLRWLKRCDEKKAAAFWREELHGFETPSTPTLPAPTDAENGHAEVRCEFSSTLANDLRALARRERLTLSSLVQGAWAILLARYCDQDDVVFGTTVSGRPADLAGVESMVGIFINTLPVRLRVPADRPLLEWLRELPTAQAKREEFGYTPLTMMREAAGLPPGASLFETLVVFENYPAAEKDSEWRFGFLKDVRVDEHTHFALNLFATVKGDSLHAKIAYPKARWQREHIAQMARDFAAILSAFAARPQQRLGEIVLSDAAREQGEAVPVSEKTIAQLFSEQAVRTPDAPALRYQEAVLSYRELDHRANRLAHKLQALGIGAEDRVAVRLPRTPDLVIALLAVLKAGAAYVPIDPRYPQERQDFLFSDSGARYLIDESTVEAGAFSDQTPTSLAGPTSLAYLIYTSGSTGVPKGVAIENRSAVNLIEWAHRVFTRAEFAGVLAATSVCFDLSVFELFVPLTIGGSVILAENALALPSLPQRNEVTLVNTVPSAIAELVRSEGLPEKVRTVNLAGEPLTRELVDTIYRHTRAERVYDLYGPSETTTYSTFTLREPNGAETIGNPIANTQAFLLDRAGQHVPDGCVGELYLGGAGVARGYWQRPELTEQRFLSQRSGRVFRTGDRARRLPDGRLQFLGRLDFQVKLRGFRIELGEIESALRRQPGVREAVAIARGAQLLAYVTPTESAVLSSEILRESLRTQMPEHMVPSNVIVLAQLPLTANGKLDRKALPAAQANPQTSSAPESETERTLLSLASEVLGQPAHDIAKDFFSLGGNSLSATQLAFRIRRRWDIELPLNQILQGATLRDLAARIDSAKLAPTPSQESVWLPVQTGSPAHAPVFLVPGAGASAATFCDLASAFGDDVPVYGLARDTSPLGDQATKAAADLPRLAGRHPIRLAGHSFGGWIALEIARRLSLPSPVLLLDAPPPAAPEEPARHYDETATREIVHRLAPARSNDPAILRDFQAVLNTRYAPTEPYRGEVHLLRAAHDASPESREARWRRHAPAICTRNVEGTHVSMLQSPHAPSLAKAMAECWRN